MSEEEAENIEVADDAELESEGEFVDDDIIDDAASDQTVLPLQYQITSYGADIDTEGFVNRLRREDVFIPPFQRDYVWNQKEASRFIESLLLGLPVPGVFLARDRDSKRLLVIDGQQRLKTLEFFFDGFFNPSPTAKRKRVFDLQGVQPQFVGKTYETLTPDDRIALNDSIIHATIVKQESPEGDNSSIYHIFERLNTSGRKLSPQQIRVAIFHGFLVALLHDLNAFRPWREIYGAKSRTLKDEELILRFFGLFYFSEIYSRPMKDFLNTCVEKMMALGQKESESWGDLFATTICYIYDALGRTAFKPERALNAAVFDSIMVATARKLGSGITPALGDFKEAYDSLLKDENYMALVSRATADENSVAKRIEMATAAFGPLKAGT